MHVLVHQSTKITMQHSLRRQIVCLPSQWERLNTKTGKSFWNSTVSMSTTWVLYGSSVSLSEEWCPCCGGRVVKFQQIESRYERTDGWRGVRTIGLALAKLLKNRWIIETYKILKGVDPQDAERMWPKMDIVSPELGAHSLSIKRIPFRTEQDWGSRGQIIVYLMR